MNLSDCLNYIRNASQAELSTIVLTTKDRQVAIGRMNMMEMRYGAIVKVMGGNCEFTGKVLEIKQKKITVEVTDHKRGKFYIGSRVNVPASMATIIG